MIFHARGGLEIVIEFLINMFIDTSTTIWFLRMLFSVVLYENNQNHFS